MIRRNKRRWESFRLTMFVIGFVLFLPLTVPVMLLLSEIDRRQMRSAAKRTYCVGCGQTLGVEALRLSNEEFHKEMTEMRAKHPNVKFRIVRPVHAICPKCSKRYRYIEPLKLFEGIAAAVASQ